MNISLANPFGLISDIVIIVILLIGIYSGYKKGFLESSIRFIGSVVSVVGAYMFKNPVAVFLYTNLPFFKIDGFFKGASVLNIVIYEVIAFIIVSSVLAIIVTIICKLTGLVNKLLSLIFLIGVPNKILGAIVGFLGGYIVVYLLVIVLMFVGNFLSYDLEGNLSGKIFNTPILHETFAPTYNALEEISTIATEYENINDKDDFNYRSLDILLKYDIVTVENVELLIGKNKIDIPGSDELLDKYN